MRGVIALLLLASGVAAQSIQMIDSEAQLAARLCQDPKEAATNELLDKHAQFVKVTLWNALLNCALSADQQQSPAELVELYKVALRVASRLNKPEFIGTSYYYLGRTYSRISDFENAIKAYEESRKLFEPGNESNLIHILANLGTLYLTLEDYENAQSYSERALALTNRLDSGNSNGSLGPIEFGRARALQTLGQIELSQGNHENALNKLRQALGLFERVSDTDSSYKLELADVLLAIAKVYREMGKYSDAFSCLNKANQVSKSARDQTTSANIMSAQASLFLEQEDYAEAEHLFAASLAIYRTLGNARGEARVLLSLAVIEERQGHNDAALLLFKRSMEGAKGLRLADLEIAAGQGVAALLTEKHDFQNALQVINQSLELARRLNAKTREAELLWRAAQIYFAMQNYGETALLAQQALTLARSLRLPKLTYVATAALGEAYAAEDKVELAITTLNEAIAQVEELRDDVTGRQESRYLFFENKLGPYHALVRLLTRQGKNTEALLYAERAKGRLLLEAVRRNTADLQNILTETEKVEIQRLHDKVLAAYEQIHSASGHDPSGELDKQLDVARSEFASFEKTLVTAHPELPLRTGPARPLTQAGLANLLRTNGPAYLEYVVTRDNVGLFIVKRNGVSTDIKYLNLPVNADELRRKVSEFHSALAERQPGYDSLGRELYRLLIAPVAGELQNVTTICIIPDAFLWTLPFQALTTTSGNYVLQEHSVFYAPSLSVLKEMALRRPQQSSNESLIAFGNPVIERDKHLTGNLHPLPEAEAEVVAVAAAARIRKKRVLVGNDAEEKIFKALAPQYATIHLATHGLLDNKDPLNSYLLLTKTDGDWQNDGLLQAREIIEMHLDADLAVLSACETGSGRISPGEGVIGMSWAFIVAGARSVVVSQWRVNSGSTSQLMKNFYQALSRESDPNSLNKSQALREASLRLLKDRRYRHPFYWAGFVLVSSN